MFLKNILKKRVKRVGRGESSNVGKTCGRGTKGQKSRSGSKISPDFEGGQTKLFKRLPKFGFKVKKKKSLNLLLINKFPFSIISIFFLKKINFIKKNIFSIKLFSIFFIFKKKIIYNVFFSNFFLFFNLNIFFIIF